MTEEERNIKLGKWIIECHENDVDYSRLNYILADFFQLVSKHNLNENEYGVILYGLSKQKFVNKEDYINNLKKTLGL